MGFLSKLFNKNPTTEWRETTAAPDVDVATMKVMSKGFRTRGEAFSALGPADKWPEKHGGGNLVWLGKGLELEFEADQLTGYQLHLLVTGEHAQPEGMKPFSGRLMRGNTVLNVRGGASEADVIAALGKPAERDDDEDETILRYRFGEVIAEFEIDKPAQLVIVNVFQEGNIDESLRRGF